jgi:hypothetical protein
MRQYEPIWMLLKVKGTATLRVAPVFAKTVKKAVMKEKNMDLAFKLTHDDDSYFLKISYDEKKSIMTFELKRRIGEL